MAQSGVAPPLESAISVDDKKDEDHPLSSLGMVATNLAAEPAPAIADASIYTPQQFKKLLRKQDLILLPLMWLCVSCNVSCPTRDLADKRPSVRYDTFFDLHEWLT